MRGLFVISTMVFGGTSLCGGVMELPGRPAGAEEDGDGAEGDSEGSCCQYSDEDGAVRFERLEGASACEEARGTQEGRWVTDPRCGDCCCKTVGRPEQVTVGECELDAGKCVAEEACEVPEGNAPTKPKRGRSH
jgi:hypothetical protein